MSTATASPHAPPHRQPRLRLVHDADSQRTEPECGNEDPAAGQGAHRGELAYVLVAGADTNARTMMLDELRNLLPTSTRFLEACETWGVLAGAAGSRMVVLTDDLRDSTTSLVRLLGRRHPALPVLTVGERARAGVAVDVSLATG
jgi:hypothetical protein